MRVLIEGAAFDRVRSDLGLRERRLNWRRLASAGVLVASLGCSPSGYEAELSVTSLECEALGERTYAWRVELVAEIVGEWDASGTPEAYSDLAYSTSRGYGFVYELANWDCGDWEYGEIDDGTTLWAGCRWRPDRPARTTIAVEHGIAATEEIATGVEVFADLRVYPGYRNLAETATRTVECTGP